MATCPKCFRAFDTGETCPHDGERLLSDVVPAGEPELLRGDKVGEYVVERRVGAGTFGVVYAGIQPLIGKQVAIKVLSRKYSADPAVVSRFLAEARAVNQIRHRNIIDIFAFGQLPDGRHYHVMELLDGSTLAEHAARCGGRLPIPELLAILRQLGRALDAAHAAGIAHRDLKPANVFLTRDEEGRLSPKLLDFGIAKLLLDDVPRQHTTATGATVGTPDYMSPEQCQGPDVDHRTDIYSFGVVAFQLLTGRLPFAGRNVIEVLMQHLSADPPRPSSIAPDVPQELDAPILAMLAKLPEARPQSLLEAVNLLDEAARTAGYEILHTGTTGDPLSPLSRSGGTPMPLAPTVPSVNSAQLRGRNQGRWWLSVGLLAVAGAGVAVAMLGLEPEPAPVIAPPRTPETVAPRLPTQVAVRFAGAPTGSQIKGADGKVLGVAPGAGVVPIWYGKSSGEAVGRRLRGGHLGAGAQHERYHYRSDGPAARGAQAQAQTPRQEAQR